MTHFCADGSEWASLQELEEGQGPTCYSFCGKGPSQHRTGIQQKMGLKVGQCWEHIVLRNGAIYMGGAYIFLFPIAAELCSTFNLEQQENKSTYICGREGDRMSRTIERPHLWIV